MLPLADVNDAYTDLVTSVFSTPIAAKAWLATVAVILAVVQVLTGARIFGKLQFIPLSGPALARVHRWSGRIAFLFTLPVFFHCVTILGFETPDTRVAIHSLAARSCTGLRREGASRPRPLAPGLGAPGRGGDDGVDARAPLADVEPLVLHERRVRLLMGRGWRPVLAGAAVVVAVFLLAQWTIFEPSSDDEPRLLGGAERGAVLFVDSCAGCHGRNGTGGTGPLLAEAGSTRTRSRPRSTGGGVMPAGS